MRITFLPYDHLIITCSQQHESVLVLRPQGQDPRTVLSVARVLLPPPAYRELADILGGS